MSCIVKFFKGDRSTNQTRICQLGRLFTEEQRRCDGSALTRQNAQPKRGHSKLQRHHSKRRSRDLRTTSQ